MMSADGAADEECLLPPGLRARGGSDTAASAKGAADAGTDAGTDSDADSTSSSTTNSSGRRGALGTRALLGVLFFNVCGGPVGSETIVSAGGPLVGLTSVLCFTLIWSVPQAMVTAELSTAFPADGGYSLWVRAAFGRFWGAQESYWSWFSGVVDNALFPALLCATASQLAAGHFAGPGGGGGGGGGVDDGGGGGGGGGDDDDDGTPMLSLWQCGLDVGPGGCAAAYWGTVAAKLAIALMFAAPNFASTRLVGRWLAGAAVFVMAPFAALSLVGLPALMTGDGWRRLGGVRRGAAAAAGRGGNGGGGGGGVSIRWSALLSALYWNLSAFDCVSTVAGEVQSPARTFPRVLRLSLLLIPACYLLPLLVAAAQPGAAWERWGAGSFAEIGRAGMGAGGGVWLGAWIALSSAVATQAQFSAELLEDSYQLLGMAEAGLAPAWLAGVRPARWPRSQRRRKRRKRREEEVEEVQEEQQQEQQKEEGGDDDGEKEEKEEKEETVPHAAMVLQLCVIGVLNLFDFRLILAVDNFFSCASALLEFAAAVALRWTQPALPRPYRVPLGAAGFTLACAPAFGLGLWICWQEFWGSTASVAVNCAALLLGLPLGYAAARLPVPAGQQHRHAATKPVTGLSARLI